MSESQSASLSKWPSLWPTLWLGGQFIVLAGLFIALDPARSSLLWDVQIGRRMLLTAIVLFTLNVAIYWSLSCILLRRITARPEGSKTILWVALVGLTVVCLIVFVLPGAFVLTIGPSAIQVQQQMLSPT